MTRSSMNRLLYPEQHPPALPLTIRTAYNQPVVQTSFSSRFCRIAQGFFCLGQSLGLSLSLLLWVAAVACAQSVPGSVPGSVQEAGPPVGGRILLVLPFDNNTSQPSLEWIREAAAEILTSRLSSAGLAPMSREDRRYALDHLGMPQDFHPSRATSIKLAETLDADSIIVGSYSTEGTDIVAEARVVDVAQLRMGPQVTARGKLSDMISVFDLLSWELTRQLDPGFSGSEQTFMAAGSGLRLDAFEQYIRGITEPDQAERVRHLNQSVLLSPGFSPAWMALGREDYADQQYEQAAAAFAKVGDNSSDADDAVEASYYRGLALLFSGDYAGAEEAFASVARELPLAEVLNNQGVALARQGKDGSSLFRKALAADPNEADYHFNLALSLKRSGNNAAALAELAQCLRLSPADSEAQAVEQAWKEPVRPTPVKPEPAKPASAKSDQVRPASANASAPTAGNSATSNDAEAAGDQSVDAEAKVDPLERIERGFDATAFRQAAQMIDQVEDARLATLPPQERAQKLSAQAKAYLDRGLLLEAERLYLAAAATDPKAAEAYVGLAQVRERTGDPDAARKEADTSLKLKPSVDAYLLLERLDLADGQREKALADLDAALKIDPENKAARELKQQLEGQK